jgi:tryptophan synthase alpha chain
VCLGENGDEELHVTRENRITAMFAQRRREGRAAFMPYLTMGYPERDSALKLVPALIDAGADMIELGVPFSDPLADGATIQVASQRALDNGMSLSLCLDQVAALREARISAPLVLMGYYNPIHQMGDRRFAQLASQAGVDGAIVPDLPPEEATDLLEALKEGGIALIFLLAPTSDSERVRLVAERAMGFHYLVSLTGVTGARDRLPPSLEAFVARVRAATRLPLAVGFGIGSPQEAARVARIADGVIVGSALIKVIAGAKATDEDPARAARAFVSSLVTGMGGGSARPR